MQALQIANQFEPAVKSSFKELLFRPATFSMQQKPIKVQSKDEKKGDFEFSVLKGSEKLGEITFIIDKDKKNNEFFEFGQIKLNPDKITKTIESHACYFCTIEISENGDQDIKVVIPAES